MEKSLIIYSTVDGQTKAICKRIAQFASETSIDVLPISNEIKLDSYKNIIIGASIRYGKYRNEVFDFIDKNIHILGT